MNKQEALVEILAQCRTYEQPHEEVRRAHLSVAMKDLERAAASLASELPDIEAERAAIVALAGAALYLLVDEVDLVTGRTLDAWLEDKKLTGTEIRSWGDKVLRRVGV